MSKLREDETGSQLPIYITHRHNPHLTPLYLSLRRYAQMDRDRYSMCKCSFLQDTVGFYYMVLKLDIIKFMVDSILADWAPLS